MQGETIIDCGAEHPGGIEAGLRMARVCMGGLGAISLVPSEALPHWPWHVVVRSSQPVAACLASQYAGWALRHDGAREILRARLRAGARARPPGAALR